MRHALLCLLLAGCGAPEARTAEPRVLIAARSDEPRAAVDGAPREPPIGSPTVHPCEHARRCCHAYVDSMTAQLPPQAAQDVHASCESFGQLQETGGEDACKSAMHTWRQAFEALGREIAPACGGPATPM